MRHPVLLHGFTGSSAAWGEAVVEGLAGAGLVATLVDLPGHGRWAGETDPRRFSLEAALEAVGAAGRWPADLIGYSMGARLALHFAAAVPERVRRLVLESGSPGLATDAERAERRRSDDALARSALEDGIEAFVDRWESQPLLASRSRVDPALGVRLRDVRLRNDVRSLAAALRGLGAGTLPSLWERLPGIGIPTLLLAGALDAKYVRIAERMAAVMPDARVVVVPEAGHTVHLERPGAWVAAVVSFLRAP